MLRDQWMRCASRYASGFRRVGAVGQQRMEFCEGPAVLWQTSKVIGILAAIFMAPAVLYQLSMRRPRHGSHWDRPFITLVAQSALLKWRTTTIRLQPGLGAEPQNRRDRIHISTAIGYLAPARHRLNLSIRPRVNVHRVLVENGRATGVKAECGGSIQSIHGRHVTLSAGAINSPAILMRSSIGPRSSSKDSVSNQSPIFRCRAEPDRSSNVSDYSKTGSGSGPRSRHCNSSTGPIHSRGLQRIQRHAAQGWPYFSTPPLRPDSSGPCSRLFSLSSRFYNVRAQGASSA